MTQRSQYELVYIIQPELNDEETQAIDERVVQTIVSNDGELTSSEIWGRRKLAYPIKDKFEGYYILHNVEMPPASVAEVERTLRLNEDVIRFLVIKPEG